MHLLSQVPITWFLMSFFVLTSNFGIGIVAIARNLFQVRFTATLKSSRGGGNVADHSLCGLASCSFTRSRSATAVGLFCRRSPYHVLPRGVFARLCSRLSR